MGVSESKCNIGIQRQRLQYAGTAAAAVGADAAAAVSAHAAEIAHVAAAAVSADAAAIADMTAAAVSADAAAIDPLAVCSSHLSLVRTIAAAAGRPQQQQKQMLQNDSKRLRWAIHTHHPLQVWASLAGGCQVRKQTCALSVASALPVTATRDMDPVEVQQFCLLLLPALLASPVLPF